MNCGFELLVTIPAGYNHYEVAEYLLERGADVNATDKGGLIPLHNASSYGVCHQHHYCLSLFTPYPHGDIQYSI